VSERNEPGTPWWGAMPAPPATMSATQLDAVLRDVRARREQVAALREQLAVFDQQLGALEATLQPLLQWSSAWAELERGTFGARRPSAPDA